MALGIRHTDGMAYVDRANMREIPIKTEGKYFWLPRGPRLWTRLQRRDRTQIYTTSSVGDALMPSGIKKIWESLCNADLLSDGGGHGRPRQGSREPQG